MTSAKSLSVLAAIAAVGTALSAGCARNDGDSPEAAPSPTPRASQTSVSPTPSLSPADRDGDGLPDHSDPYPDDPKNIPRQPLLRISCYLTADYSSKETFSVEADDEGRPDFTEIWAKKPISCDAGDKITPISDIEKNAYKISKYDDNDISTLYEICAEVDPDDVYTEDGYAASEDQISEINAALALCPKHWKKASGSFVNGGRRCTPS